MNKVITIRKANKNDIKNVLKLYSEVIDQIRYNESNPNWEHGTYPRKEDICTAINSGELYVGVKEEEIASAIVINNKSNEGYENVKWNLDVDDEYVYYIHLVAVNQRFRKQGFAKKMLNYAFDLAKENSIKSIRLSIHMNNLGIEPVYTKFGFKYVDTIEVNNKYRGLLSFKVYEKIL